MKSITQLADGNPGALNFIMNLSNPTVPTRTLVKVDKSGMVGTDLYVLWSDLCDCDMEKVIKLMDNCPLDKLQDACSRQDRSGKEIIFEYLND